MNVNRGAAIPVWNKQRFVGRDAQHILLMELVPKTGHERDVGRRRRAQVEDFQSFVARDRTDELVEAGGAATDLLTRDEFVLRSAPARTTEYFAEDTRGHCALLYEQRGSIINVCLNRRRGACGARHM